MNKASSSIILILLLLSVLLSTFSFADRNGRFEFDVGSKGGVYCFLQHNGKSVGTAVDESLCLIHGQRNTFEFSLSSKSWVYCFLQRNGRSVAATRESFCWRFGLHNTFEYDLGSNGQTACFLQRNGKSVGYTVSDRWCRLAKDVEPLPSDHSDFGLSSNSNSVYDLNPHRYRFYAKVPHEYTFLENLTLSPDLERKLKTSIGFSPELHCYQHFTITTSSQRYSSILVSLKKSSEACPNKKNDYYFYQFESFPESDLGVIRTYGIIRRPDYSNLFEWEALKEQLPFRWFNLFGWQNPRMLSDLVGTFVGTQITELCTGRRENSCKIVSDSKGRLCAIVALDVPQKILLDVKNKCGLPGN